MGGDNRRTLKFIRFYPTPEEIHKQIVKSEGWEYKQERDKRKYQPRDRALVSILYLLALRVSEALRLRKEQFLLPSESGRDNAIVVRGIELSKSRWKEIPRKDQFRTEGFLPLTGRRAPLTQLVANHISNLEGEEKLFKFKNFRAWQITTATLNIPNHWLRAYGENFLYDMWKHDLLAVADYIKVNPRTLALYVRRGYEKYDPV